MSKKDWQRSWPAWLRATAIGFPSVPSAGGAKSQPSLSYATEKRLTKYPHEFGHGAIEGVAGPEAANNASVTGALVPLLTLGNDFRHRGGFAERVSKTMASSPVRCSFKCKAIWSGACSRASISATFCC
jgi:hypothetical protein